MNKKILSTILTLLFMATIAFASNAEKKNVLIIGDSISMGYTPILQEIFEGKLNIERIEGNGFDTKNGIANMDKFLGDKKWDIIHFNFGLHDLCYRTDHEKKIAGTRNKEKGTIAASLEEYEKNLQIIVDMLKKTNATLIFATTTYVPEGERGRVVGDEIKYNAVALKVMQKNNIMITPLYEISAKIHGEFGMGEGNVHYRKAGNRLFAERIAENLEPLIKE